MEKKKKKKSKLKTNKDKEGGQSEVHQNVEETGATTTTVLPSDDGTSRAISKERDEGVSPLGEEGGQQPPKTEAERKYEETRRKRVCAAVIPSLLLLHLLQLYPVPMLINNGQKTAPRTSKTRRHQNAQRTSRRVE